MKVKDLLQVCGSWVPKIKLFLQDPIHENESKFLASFCEPYEGLALNEWALDTSNRGVSEEYQNLDIVTFWLVFPDDAECIEPNMYISVKKE